MGTNLTQNRSTTVISYLAVGIVIALVIGQSLNPAISQSDGTTVIINSPTDLVFTQGQEVKLLVSRRLIANAKSYTIMKHGATQ